MGHPTMRRSASRFGDRGYEFEPGKEPDSRRLGGCFCVVKGGRVALADVLSGLEVVDGPGPGDRVLVGWLDAEVEVSPPLAVVVDVPCGLSVRPPGVVARNSELPIINPVIGCVCAHV